jgi:steroid 5-alpha reductase family enzyme
VTQFSTADFLVGAVASLGAVAVLQGLTFGVALRVGRHSVVDVTWGAGFAVVAAVSWALSLGTGGDLRRTVVLVLTASWGLRLAGHIALRARHHRGEDPRYVELLDRAQARGVSRTWYAVTRIYATQAVSLWFISLPVQVAMFTRGGLGALGALGVLVWAVGLFFEAVGDYQLTRFRNDPTTSGRVLDTGLWRYTRHPNYFGDACVWWGLSLIAFARFPGILTIASPILMTYLLARGTGAKLLESTIGDRRAGYVDYVRSTSGFVPLPPRKVA